ncbi:MAG: glycosyltransferase [Candidatus Heimdallarchaeota archaeon]
MFSPILKRINFSIVSKVVLVSDVIKRELLKQIPGLKEKVIIIPHGIQTQNFHFSNKKQRTRKICVISSLIQLKRIDLIMKALKSIDNISLHIAGDGRLLNNLMKLARELKIDGRTLFYGQIPHHEIPRWLLDKDIIINASDRESFAVSLIEGMSLGVIPLIRNWPGADEIYPNEFILPFRDQEFIDSLYKRVVEFYNLSEDIVEKKREQVRIIAKGKFSFNKQVERYDKLFSEILLDKTQQ